MTRRSQFVLLLAIVGALAIVSLPDAESSTDARAGGIFKVSFQGSSSLQAFDYVDPALAYSRESWALLDTVCARLMRYRDTAPPAGYRIVPEVAAAPPVVSRDGKTWTFKLRSGFRFSDGRPVRADAFAQAIHRTMAPGVDSPGYIYTRAIVGAEDVHTGRASKASGVVARDNTLVVRFTREIRDFDAWTTMPFFCAVPPALPPSAEGVQGFPGSGPYTIREYRPNERVVIRRNRYYGGNREHHVDGFDVDLSANSPQEVLDRIEASKADWGHVGAEPAFEPDRRLISKYGIDYSRFWVTPGLTVSMFVLNSSRPLFRDNPQLRRAVSFALDRNDFTTRGTAKPTDQYLPESVPGFRDHLLYPPGGNLDRAKALAHGNLRGGKAILYVPEFAQKSSAAQLCAEILAEIGLEVELRNVAEFPRTSAYLGRLGNPDEPWDLAQVLWSPDFVDGSAFINRLLDGLAVGGTNLAGFDDAASLAKMRRAAQLRGAARERAYSDLELALGRDAVPVVPMAVYNEVTLVSKRVLRDCMLLRPGLVLTTVCLKR